MKEFRKNYRRNLERTTKVNFLKESWEESMKSQQQSRKEFLKGSEEKCLEES